MSGKAVLKRILRAVFAPRYGANTGYVNPLSVNLGKIKVSDPKPFVSIHVAIYNEKRVVERLIRACTSQEWYQAPQIKPINADSAQRVGAANYEVIIADDSNDETTEILKQTLVSGGWTEASYRNNRENRSSEIGQSINEDSQIETNVSDNQPGEEMFAFRKPGAPIVKIIHRFSRRGFKGAALQRALEETAPQAQYIVILDADFVPYPDTVEQFVKTFQVLTPINADKNADLTDSAKSASDQSNQRNNIAAVQGYQWHVLNKSQTWITRGVRTEYAGSYVIERSGEELYGGLKQIAGSVYAIRTDVLRKFGWGTSITEDFELTLRLYEAGYKVVFTPYIQVPAEAASTLRRIIRQRMRWAEGSSFNIKVMFVRMFRSPNMSRAEKWEFAYFAFYYLQAAFFVVGTFSWFISETIFNARLPFWTAAFGWSLVFANLFALPLMNIVGLFLEESDERDYVGILSFLALSYIVVPFQAYAAIKGFLETQEGPWFRTPKTGLITDVFDRSGFNKFFGQLFGKKAEVSLQSTDYGLQSTDYSLRTTDYGLPSRLGFVPLAAENLRVRPKHLRYVGNLALGLVIAMTVLMSLAAPLIPVSDAYAYEQAMRTVEGSQSDRGTEDIKGIEGQGEPSFAKASEGEEFVGQRVIGRTSKDGYQTQFIFDSEGKVRIKLPGGGVGGESWGRPEIEFETKKVGGESVSVQKAIIYGDREVIYEEILPGVDLWYTVGEDMVREQVVVKSRETALRLVTGGQSDEGTKDIKALVEQSVRTVDVKVVSPSPDTFGFYPENCGSTPGVEETCKELFKFTGPFAVDEAGEKSVDMSLRLDKGNWGNGGYGLTKSLGEAAKSWLVDPARVYPVYIDPSVVVSGGIVDADVQFGGLQSKLAYASSAWYAFYDDAADVSYKKSSDGSSWDAAVDVDTADARNHNPSVWVEGTDIYIVWADDNGNTDVVEVNRLNTTNDTLGTKCTSADWGNLTASTFTFSISVDDFGDVYLASADTSTDTEVAVWNLTYSGCTFTTGLATNSGLGASDRPVLISPGMGAVMIFQDAGDLSIAITEGAGAATAAATWPISNATIAAVTDAVYAATTDGTTVWVLAISGTTATNFYAIGAPSYTDIDTNVGTNVAKSDINCPTATDCKIVYHDTGLSDVFFTDCNDATCSSPTTTAIDDAVGASSGLSVAIDCPAADGADCKVIYSADVTSAFTFADCNNATCSAPVLVNIGAQTSAGGSVDIECPSATDCKVVYLERTDSDVVFVDCNDASCSTSASKTIDSDAGGLNLRGIAIDCPQATDCKVVYQETANSDVVFVDCADASCSGSIDCNAEPPTGGCTDIDAAIGTAGRFVGIDCPQATDCKVVYGDSADAHLTFVDCGDASCSDVVCTEGSEVACFDIDTNSGGGRNDIYCPTATDCKVSYRDTTDGDTTFVDCADASCSSNVQVDIDADVGTGAGTGAVIDCPVADDDDCKVVYNDATDGDVTFVDCNDVACYAVTAATDPWTGEAGVETVSITYDSTNSDLYAHIIMDDTSGSDQAFWKTTDAATIDWTATGDGTSYAFTAGDLAEISCNQVGAGSGQIGCVLRQGSNFEFAPVPERLYLLLIGLPFVPKIYETLRRRRD